MKYEKITDPDGVLNWYLNELLHRENGPAVLWPDGTQFWYLNGLLHRTDGPAYICPTFPTVTQFWYLNGTKLNVEQVNTYKYLLECPLKKLPLYLENQLFIPVIEKRFRMTPKNRP